MNHFLRNGKSRGRDTERKLNLYMTQLKLSIEEFLNKSGYAVEEHEDYNVDSLTDKLQDLVNIYL